MFEFDRGEFGFVPSSIEPRLNSRLLCGLFFRLVNEKKFSPHNNFCKVYQIQTKIKWRRK
jgi:hypothetical protein